MKKNKKQKPKLRFAIASCRFNERINQGLVDGAKKFFAEQNISIAGEDCFLAPGAFELPLLAQTLAKTKKYQGVVCLGAVIKGDTAHFEFVSLGATMGIQDASLNTGVPVAFGVITTYTVEQALDRAQDNAINKGREAAAACYDIAVTLKKIRGK